MAIFTAPTFAGYGSIPPDDGSQSAVNEVSWAKIKTKLADPIKSYVDALVTYCGENLKVNLNTDSVASYSILGYFD